MPLLIRNSKKALVILTSGTLTLLIKIPLDRKSLPLIDQDVRRLHTLSVLIYRYSCKILYTLKIPPLSKPLYLRDKLDYHEDINWTGGRLIEALNVAFVKPVVYETIAYTSFMLSTLLVEDEVGGVRSKPQQRDIGVTHS